MKKLKELKWILCCTSACLLASAVLAQDYSLPPTRAGTDQSASKSKQFCPSKDLVGANVKDSQSQKCGDISEIYINPQNGQTLAAIDIGSRRHAIVPVQALSVSAAGGTFHNAEVMINKSKSELESGPTIVDNEWQKLDDSTFTQSAYNHYGIQAPSAMGGAESPGGGARGGETNQPPIRPLTPTPGQPQP